MDVWIYLDESGTPDFDLGPASSRYFAIGGAVFHGGHGAVLEDFVAARSSRNALAGGFHAYADSTATKAVLFEVMERSSGSYAFTFLRRRTPIPPFSVARRSGSTSTRSTCTSRRRFRPFLDRVTLSMWWQRTSAWGRSRSRLSRPWMESAGNSAGIELWFPTSGRAPPRRDCRLRTTRSGLCSDPSSRGSHAISTPRWSSLGSVSALFRGSRTSVVCQSSSDARTRRAYDRSGGWAGERPAIPEGKNTRGVLVAGLLYPE